MIQNLRDIPKCIYYQRIFYRQTFKISLILLGCKNSMSRFSYHSLYYSCNSWKI